MVIFSGVLWTKAHSILLVWVESIELKQTFLGHYFGSGDIVLLGFGSTEQYLTMVDKPSRLRRMIQMCMR